MLLVGLKTFIAASMLISKILLSKLQNMLADNISQTQDYCEYTVMISKIKNLYFTKTMWDYVI